MIPLCCGKPRATNYCPDCGKPMVDEPILQLLAHCRKIAIQHRSQHDAFVKGCEEQTTDEDKEFFRTLIKRSGASAVKWESYCSALEDLLATARKG